MSNQPSKMQTLVEQLRAGARLEHCDLTLMGDAADEIERLRASLALQVEQEAKNWWRGDDERDRLRAALVRAETVMMIIEPRNNKAQYLDALALVRAALSTETAP